MVWQADGSGLKFRGLTIFFCFLEASTPHFCGPMSLAVVSASLQMLKRFKLEFFETNFSAHSKYYTIVITIFLQRRTVSAKRFDQN